MAIYDRVFLPDSWTLLWTRPTQSGGKNGSADYVNKHPLQPPASLRVPTATLPPDTHTYTRSLYTLTGSYMMVRAHPVV
jgi:hypothetical protein